MERSEELEQAFERQRQMDLQSADTPPTGSLGELPWTFTSTPSTAINTDAPAQSAGMQVSAQHEYSEEEYHRAKTFVNSVLKPYAEKDKKRRGTESGHQAMYQYPIGNGCAQMSDEQWLPISMCMKQSRLRRGASANHQDCAPMRMILNGEGGSGKSWLIRHIVKDVHSVWNEVGTSVRKSRRVLLMAHLGTAAFNIKGSTICSALGFGASGLGTNNPYKSIEGTDTLRALQDKYEHVQLVVIDEYSVISCGMLYSIDQRMREIWPSCRHLPFGGRDTILSGDMGQLAPVLPATLATPKAKLHNRNQNEGRRLWESFNHVFTLKSQKRGCDDPEWYNALSRLRRMQQSTADLQLFNSRYFSHDEFPSWTKQATHVSYRNNDVDEANEQRLLAGEFEIFEIPAEHGLAPNLKRGDVCQPLDAQIVASAEADAKYENSQRDRVVRPFIRIAVGVPVTLTHNICQPAGLCNGTKAVVYDFMISPASTIPIMLVQVKDKYIGPSYLDNVPDIVPIPPQSVSWLSSNKNLRVTVTGIPLRAAFAMTVHKVQGLTCPQLVFNPVAIPTSSFAYVGLSRVSHREDIVLTRALKPINTKTQQTAKEILQCEWKRLAMTESQTRSQAETTVARMQTIAILENQRNALFAR